MTSQQSYDTPADDPVADEAAPRRGWREMVDNPWLVLATLFLVTAALGLPVLWMSRGFSRTTKIVLSLVVVLYTALLLYVFWLVMVWSYTRVVDSL